MFDSIRTIPVRVRPPYDVRIGSGLLGRCGDYLAALLGQRRIAVLADDTVASLYLDTVTAALEDAGFAVCSHIFPSGEGRKNLSTLTELLEFLASEHLTRTDCVAALGGGVTGDMAGFAAAVYLRGIRYVQLPTTLLAAVDSSVGGKTAVDLTAGKNLAGAFCQPAAVICDTDCLKTLPPDVFADGAAEAVKTGVLSDEALFALFEDGTLTADPGEVIARCVAYKAGVVERDEKEQGERKLLNLGHTVGHAIEKCSGYVIPHGHAVAAGLAVIARAADEGERPAFHHRRPADRPGRTGGGGAGLSDSPRRDAHRRHGGLRQRPPDRHGGRHRRHRLYRPRHGAGGPMRAEVLPGFLGGVQEPGR